MRKIEQWLFNHINTSFLSWCITVVILEALYGIYIFLEKYEMINKLKPVLGLLDNVATVILFVATIVGMTFILVAVLAFLEELLKKLSAKMKGETNKTKIL